MPHLPALAAPRPGVGGSLLCSVKLCHLLHLSGEQHWRARCRQSFFFFFLMRQDQAQDVTLVSGTGDRRENCLENRGEIMEASMLQEEGRSESRKGREKEKKPKWKIVLNGKAGLD